MGLLRLVKQHGPERLDAACARAVAAGARSYRPVESILKHGLDRLPLDAEPVPPSPRPLHDNVRGPAYYERPDAEAFIVVLEQAHDDVLQDEHLRDIIENNPEDIGLREYQRRFQRAAAALFARQERLGTAFTRDAKVRQELARMFFGRRTKRPLVSAP